MIDRSTHHLERPDNILAAVAEAGISRSAEPRERVHDREHAKLSPRSELVVDEVGSPLGLNQWRSNGSPQVSLAAAGFSRSSRSFAWSVPRKTTPAERQIVPRGFRQLMTNPTSTSGLDTTCRLVELANSQARLGRPTMDGAVWMMLTHEIADRRVAWAFILHNDDTAEALIHAEQREHARVASESAT